ncbi:MAG: DciA family protein [Patescibacteria group bacterium]
MFTPLNQILPRAMIQLGVKKEVDAAIVCERYRKLASKIVHKDALNHTFPKSYKGRTLTIGVENSAWAEAVVSKKDALIKELNLAFGKNCVAFLKTRVTEKDLLNDPRT